MVVHEDVKTDQGVMLICHGQEVTTAIREHLVKFQTLGTLTKRILCARVPGGDGTAAPAGGSTPPTSKAP